MAVLRIGAIVAVLTVLGVGCGDHIDDRVSNDIRNETCTATICGDDCVDLNVDPQNCGSCGHVCGGLAICTGGVCVL